MSVPLSTSTSQGLIDHALFLLSLSQRMAINEQERHRAMEMRQDALSLLVIGEQMKQAEESERESQQDELIPPAYHSFPVASAGATTTTTASTMPDAVTLAAGLKALIHTGESILTRIQTKYDLYGAALVSDTHETLSSVLASPQAQQMIEEGSRIVNGWKEYMMSKEGEELLNSLYSRLNAQHINAQAVISYVASIAQAATSAATTQTNTRQIEDPQTQRREGETDRDTESITALLPASHSFSLSSLSEFPSTIQQLLSEHPELQLLLLRVQSALLDDSSDEDAVMAEWSAKGRQLLHMVKEKTEHGEAILPPNVTQVISNSLDPVVSLLKQPDRVIHEAMQMLSRRERREEVLDGIKQLIISQLSVALSSMTFPALSGQTDTFSYQIDSFCLSSFSLQAENIQLHTNEDDDASITEFTVTIDHVSAEAQDVGWQCSQLVFPYLRGSGTMDGRMREASLHVTIKVAKYNQAAMQLNQQTHTAQSPNSDGYFSAVTRQANDNLQVRFIPYHSSPASSPADNSTNVIHLSLSSLSFSFPSLSFHVHRSALSAVYNFLLSLFSPLLITQLEHALNQLCSSKTEEWLEGLNTYGGEILHRIWGNKTNKQQQTQQTEEPHTETTERTDTIHNTELSQTQQTGLEGEKLAKSDLDDAARHTQPETKTGTTQQEADISSKRDTPTDYANHTAVSATAPVSPSPSLSVPVRTPPLTRRSLRHPHSRSVTPSAPSGSSPFLLTDTPPLLASYPDISAGW